MPNTDDTPDPISAWRNHHLHLSEAARFAGDLFGAEQWQVDMRLRWERHVVPLAFGKSANAEVLKVIDDWLSEGDDKFSWSGVTAKSPGFRKYRTQANLVLDAVATAQPPTPNDNYARWRSIKEQISVNAGSRWFVSRVFADYETYRAFVKLLAQLSISVLNPFSDAAAQDDSSAIPLIVDGDPNAEKGFVQLLDLPDSKTVSDWFTRLRGYQGDSTKHFVCNLVQVMRAVQEERNKDLDCWIGDYRDVVLEVQRYSAHASPPASEPRPSAPSTRTPHGPGILLGQRDDRLVLSVGGDEVVMFDYQPKGAFPTLAWQAEASNKFGGELSFGSVVDLTQDSGYVGNRIQGRFLVPRAYGSRFYGLDLVWPSDAEVVEIAVVAKADAPAASGPSWVDELFGTTPVGHARAAFEILGSLVLATMVVQGLRGCHKWAQEKRAKWRWIAENIDDAVEAAPVVQGSGGSELPPIPLQDFASPDPRWREFADAYDIDDDEGDPAEGFGE